MSSIAMEDQQVASSAGLLFSRSWLPDAARGAPIVLLHDSLGCVTLWRDFPQQLARACGRRVIAYDRLGFGRSDPHRGRIDLDFIKAEARNGFAAVREHYGLQRFALFGHSVGGGMAVACAAEHADACEAVIAESAQAFVEDRTLEGVRAAQQAFAADTQLDRLRKYHGDKAPWVLSAWIDTWLDPTYADWTLDDAIRHVKCPLLALHGDNDEYGSALHPQRLAALATGPSAMRLLESCGHVPHREQTQAVLELSCAWLAKGS